MIRPSFPLAIFVAYVIEVSLITAHPSDEQGNHPEALTYPSSILLPHSDGPSPWSDKPILNDPSRFQIAIMTDRTGGHRPGIWMKAVRRMNILRPQFVVSVGDLIEGYTADRQQLRQEWEEFLGFIDKLDMKFFFVAGNHDLTNPVMHELWRNRFGAEWYSFDYRGVHFLCLCTEDPVSKLGDQQLKWIEQDLAESVNARWTLIFLHKPLWAYAEREQAAGNDDPTGWTRVEAALGNRPRTVFAGHHHSYVQYDRRGMKYYQLATTGGASRLRGKTYGEFDHVVWLTMENEGPHLANIMLDGIAHANTVTEQSIARLRQFLSTVQLEVAPILLDSVDGFLEGRLDLRLTNEFDLPVGATGQLNGVPLRGLTLAPEQLNLAAEPGQSGKLSMTLKFGERVAFSQLTGTAFTATLRAGDLMVERIVPVVIDQRYTVPFVESSPRIDGDLSEWPRLAHGTTDDSLVLNNPELWQGADDSSVQFGVWHDDAAVYVVAQVRDDRVTERDHVAVRLDARPLSVRAGETRLRDGTYIARVTAPTETSPSSGTLRERQKHNILDKIVSAAITTKSGYAIELAIPSSLIKRQQGDDWHSFQMTVIVNDFDEADQDSSRVVWRGTSNVDIRNSGLGHFVPVK